LRSATLCSIVFSSCHGLAKFCILFLGLANLVSKFCIFLSLKEKIILWIWQHKTLISNLGNLGGGWWIHVTKEHKKETQKLRKNKGSIIDKG